MAKDEIKPVVLVVDDDDAVRMIHEQILDIHGFSVRTAGDVKAALGIIAKAVPDAVLLDMSMPGASGLAVIEAIRGHETATHVPIIAVTGMPEDADFWRGEEWGWDRYMQKPVMPDDLIAALQEELDKARGKTKRSKKRS